MSIIEKTEHWEVLMTRTQTQFSGFMYIVESDYANLTLRITVAGTLQGNTGKVFYRAAIIPDFTRRLAMGGPIRPVPLRESALATQPPAEAKPVAAPKPVVKGPVPAPDLLKESDALVRELYRTDKAASLPPAQKIDLAQQLVARIDECRDDALVIFSLAREARDLAASAGNAPLALRAIDLMSVHFTLETLGDKAAAIRRASETAVTPEAKRNVAEAAIRTMYEALAADDFERVKSVGMIAELSATRIADASLAARAKQANAEANEIKREFNAKNAAMAKLKTLPNDAVSKTTVGKYLCLCKGNWSEGLPLLAGGTGGALRDLTAKEIAKPSDVSASMSIADGWWDSAGKMPPAQAANAKRHAVEWYTRALPSVEGLTRTKAEVRISSIEGAKAPQVK